MSVRYRGGVRTVIWNPNPGPQYEILRRPEKELLYGGSRGSGKTEAGLAWMSDPRYTGRPNYSGLVIRKDYEDLAQWIDRARLFYGDLAKIVGKPAEIRWRNGGVTRLGHWKDKDTISKYIGQEYWRILIEELTQTVRNEEEYNMILGSCRCSEPDLTAQLLGTTNPGGPGHTFVKKHWIDIDVIRECTTCHGEGCSHCEGGWIKTGEKATSRLKVYRDPRTGYSRLFIPAGVGDNPKVDKGYEKWLKGLPEPLRSAWYFGSWDLYEGQFFVDYGVPEEPFEIPERDVRGRLFGSLDSGTTHATSFGLWWVSDKWHEGRFGRENTIHRIFTYKANGGTIASHAQEIFDRIESNPYTKGHFPDIVWYDYAMDTKVKLNEYSVRSATDEYTDLFNKLNGKHTRFVPANKNKHNGCQVMKMLFNIKDNAPYVFYFAGKNRDYVDGMMAAITDKNDSEVYAKQDGDDVADESRYGLIGIWSWLNGMVENDENMGAFKKYAADLAHKDWQEM